MEAAACQELGGHGALVKGGGTTGGNLPIALRQFGITKQLTGLRQTTTGQKRLRGGGIFAQHLFAVLPVHAHHFAHRESRLGVSDGGRQHVGKALAAKAREQLLPAVHRAGYGGRINAAPGHRGASLGAQVRNREPLGRPARGVQSVELARLRFVDDREQVTADAIVHWRHETHHGVHGDGGIDGVATALENGGANLRGQHTFAGHHALFRQHHGARLRAILSPNALRCKHR